MKYRVLTAEFWQDFWIVAFGIILIAGLFLGQGLVLAFGVMGLLAGAISVVWNKVALEDVVYERHLPLSRVFVGDEVAITLSLTNKKPVPLAWVRTQDEFPEALELADGDVLWNAYAKIQSLRHSTSLAWYEKVRWEYRFRCNTRGLFHIGPAAIESGDPFGFHRTFRRESHRDSIIVYPKIFSLKELGMPAVRPLGEVRGGIRIFTDPTRPSGIRDYRPGDSLRTMDWKATARSQQLKVRTFEPSSSYTIILAVAVDTTERYWRPDFPEDTERVIVAAASVASYAAHQQYVIGLFSNDAPAVSGGAMMVPPGRGEEQLTEVLGTLASIRSFAVAPMSSQLALYSQRFPMGATVVLATAFVSAETVGALSDLKDRGYGVVVLHVGDKPCPQMAEGIPVYELRQYLDEMELASEFGSR